MFEKQINNILEKGSEECLIDLRNLLIQKFPLPVVETKIEKVKPTFYFSRSEMSYHMMKLPKQERVVLQSLPPTPTTLESWAKFSIENGLVTKQDPSRIILYYLKDMIDRGLVTKSETNVQSVLVESIDPEEVLREWNREGPETSDQTEVPTDTI